MTRHALNRRELLQLAAATAAGSVAGTRPLRAAEAAGGSSGGYGRQAIACSREEAADAARSVFEQGGNAIDAAVAALLVQCVIEPMNVGLGGYGGSLVYYEAKSGRVHAIDCDSQAPRAFNPDTFTEALGSTLR